ncbi:TolC family protein [Fusobacterium polymorphum]|uniref:Uncharacterized protein n=1 Tax=Fusobacterium nucleatum subsp. polymorphum TaxID=76857 RepID=A0A2C6CDH7_FUSNP|nr:TolC family protein [Fusobacterium polymorphum]PHI14441.1 hypothetical protein CBG59_12730 [Fusobacterium polymorphum]
MKKIIVCIALLSTMACTNTNINNSYKQSTEDFKVYQEISNNYKVDKEWWKEYNNSELNNIMNIALKNNSDLKKAAINVNKALYQANLLGANLVPSFSSSLGSSASKNVKTGGNSTVKHSANISLSYELDLWKKLANLNDKIEQYEKINTVMKNKYQYGVSSELEYLQSEQSLTNLKNTLLTYQEEKTQQEQSLRDLLNLKPEENIEIKTKDLLSFKDIGVNLDVPISVIANRPDVKAYEYRLSKAFKDVKATQAKLYPSVTIQSTLSSSGNKVDNALSVPVGLASINISLPFLNWNTLKWNIKIDEASYESAKVDFEKSIVSSLNEIDTYYKSYQKANSSYALQEKNLKSQKEITKHYKNRYDNGNVEFKSWLEALINEKDSELNLLKAKFDIIQAENKVYQAMGGKAK